MAVVLGKLSLSLHVLRYSVIRIMLVVSTSSTMCQRLCRDVEVVIFQTLPLPLLYLSLPLPPTKNEKTTVDNFLKLLCVVACLLLHFITLRKQKLFFTAITLPTSLELIASNYFVFVFLRYQNSC